jgi:hypothetical protein
MASLRALRRERTDGHDQPLIRDPHENPESPTHRPILSSAPLGEDVERQKIEAKHADASISAIAASPRDLDLDESRFLQDLLAQALKCRGRHLQETIEQPVLPGRFESRIVRRRFPGLFDFARTIETSA